MRKADIGVERDVKTGEGYALVMRSVLFSDFGNACLYLVIDMNIDAFEKRNDIANENFLQYVDVNGYAVSAAIYRIIC